jgi:hypothetical protein
MPANNNTNNKNNNNNNDEQQQQQKQQQQRRRRTTTTTNNEQQRAAISNRSDDALREGARVGAVAHESAGGLGGVEADAHAVDAHAVLAHAGRGRAGLERHLDARRGRGAAEHLQAVYCVPAGQFTVFYFIGRNSIAKQSSSSSSGSIGSIGIVGGAACDESLLRARLVVGMNEGIYK